jgi:hypothetical protein
MTSTFEPLSASDDPCFPPELFLEVFSHADRSSLVSLCSTSLAFLELATPFLYSTVHLDDLPDASSTPPRSPRLADLLRRLTLPSIQTLHLTIPSHPSKRILPHQHDLPKLRHVYIHNPGNEPQGEWMILSSFVDFLASLHPLSLTFNLTPADGRSRFDDWILPTSDWKACISGWTRLRHVTLYGGSLIDDDWSDDEGYHTSPILHRKPDERPLGEGSLTITYDVRGMDLEGMSESEWPESIFREGEVLELAPVSKIVIKTSTEEVAAWVDTELRKQEATARDRVEIEVVRTDANEGESLQRELNAWRRRGRRYEHDRGYGIGDMVACDIGREA